MFDFASENLNIMMSSKRNLNFSRIFNKSPQQVSIYPVKIDIYNLSKSSGIYLRWRHVRWS